MNEISILMHLLSRKKDLYHNGATQKEIFEGLNLKNRNQSIFFQKIIIELANYIEPIGLQVRYNPLDAHWFISFDSGLSDHIMSNPFKQKPSLAATLFCTLACCLKNSGYTTIHEIKRLRNKKGLYQDLKDLEKRGYIIIERSTEKVMLTPLIGYQLDMNKLILNLALRLNKLKDKKI